MSLYDLYAHDLVFEHEATEATGVPGTVIRKWASRGKIRRFPGRSAEFAGTGHERIVMYALPEIRERAATYRPMPQRNPKAA
ncbi:hypothetical protein [Streptomyces sp. ISL-94]|uniref:hypothetical protein n=1 Tax=Streptomyces sp. ISL-94 TaxID=2819190 RepID=UPI001BE6FCF9|nr:hypothetical protein [Streptomyces sp. ISL-94]MBT2477631.1 hypothetical protein [Streptomyces sp. ISL-94]